MRGIMYLCSGSSMQKIPISHPVGLVEIDLPVSSTLLALKCSLLQVLLLHSIAPTATCAAPCPSPARLPRPRIAVGPVPNNVERLKGLAPVHTHAALFLFLSIISISVQPHPSKIIALPSSLYLHFPSQLHCIARSSSSRLAQPCLVLHSAQSHLNCTPRTHIHSRQRRILLVK